MKKAISIVVAMSVVLTTLWLSGLNSSAQQSGKGPSKDDDALTKSLKKNRDRLPPQVNRAASPDARAAWERLTPTEREAVKAKVHEIIRTEGEKHEKEKRAKEAALKTWDDVIKAEGKNSDEDETLSYIDKAGNHHSMKAKRHDGSIKPGRGASVGSTRLRKEDKDARLVARRSRAPWEDDWASPQKFSSGSQSAKWHHSWRSPLKKASIALVPQAGCSQGPEQFVRAFYQGALTRSPFATELPQLMDSLGQAQSQGTLLTTVQNLGYTLFQSQEYANRGRSDSEFVTDLYLAFLQRQPEPDGFAFWLSVAQSNGRNAVIPGFANSLEFQFKVNGLCNVATFDGDHDNLSDNFENALGDAFTPNYHVSQYETDNYSTFEDSVPQRVKQPFGQNPVSHFRVLPLSNPIRQNPYTGRLESFLRIDYLTLWDHDSGLVGDLCGLDPNLVILQGTGAHQLDNERSALLVSAPVPDPNNPSINFDPNAYSVLSIFTSAHEDTFIDQSMYNNFPQTPRPAGTHFDLWQSLSKHSTYSFDPDFLPLLQVPLIITIFTVEALFYLRSSCDLFDFACGGASNVELAVFLAAVYFTVILLLTCFVERFFEQGFTTANVRINVGEPPGFNGFGVPGGNPINSSGFILDDSPQAFHLYSTLLKPLRFESLIP